MKYILKNWKWYNEFWQEQEPDNIIDYTKEIKINNIQDLNKKNIQEYNLNKLREVEDYNKNKEKIIAEEHKKELEEKTIQVLKYNELI